MERDRQGAPGRGWIVTEYLIVMPAAMIVLAICVILVLHPDYEDGLVGRIALALLGVGALARLLAMFSADRPLLFSPIALLIWAGLALFFARHFYRFMRRRKRGTGDWREAGKAATAGKRGGTA